MDTDRVLASDAEREEYAARIREAVTEGRLTLGEGDERLAAVYATRYRDELEPGVAGLPRPQPAAAPSPAGPRRVGPRGGRGPGPLLPVAVIAGLVGLWALSGAHFFWPAIPITFIVLGMLGHRFGHHHPHWNHQR